MKRIKNKVSSIATVILVLTTILCFYLIVQTCLYQETSLFGYRCFYVVTGSMEPTIPIGSAVLVKSQGERAYRVGDVITFRSQDDAIYGSPNTHRILEVQESDGTWNYVTKGDANSTKDPKSVSQKQVYGKVVWHSAAVVWLMYVLSFLNTRAGFFTAILLPVLWITISSLREFTRAFKAEAAQAARDRVEKDAQAAEHPQEPENPEKSENPQSEEADL